MTALLALDDGVLSQLVALWVVAVATLGCAAAPWREHEPPADTPERSRRLLIERLQERHEARMRAHGASRRPRHAWYPEPHGPAPWWREGAPDEVRPGWVRDLRARAVRWPADERQAV